MPFTFVLPQTANEALILLTPLVTVLLGLAFLVLPGRMLAIFDLAPNPRHPDAIGEGRATYGGALLGFGLCCLLLQEPAALQPGLNTMLGVAWFVAAFGFLLQMVVDGHRTVTVFTSVIVSTCLAVLALESGDELRFGLTIPQNLNDQILAGISLLTLVLGLIALVLPDTAMKIMRLQSSDDNSATIGQTRGILAGFYISSGLGVLVASDPAVAVLWLQFVLGAVWLCTGLGRMVGMILDPRLFRGFTVYNILAVIFELLMGGYIFGSIFGYL